MENKNNDNNKQTNTTCAGLCSVDTEPVKRWVASAFYWHATLFRKQKKNFWNPCTIQKQGLGKGGKIACIELNCVVLWIGRGKRGVEWPMHVTGKNTHTRVLIKAC